MYWERANRALGPAFFFLAAFCPLLSSANQLTEDQARAVVLVRGDNAEGTGFLVRMADGPVVITNQHVIADNPNVKITTNNGTQLTILSYKGAIDRDLAMIAVQDGKYSYLTLATDVSGSVQANDEVITPGNSEGGEVLLNTDGKVLGLGPDRVEFNNPLYHGNSGGPVFHVKSGRVIGVATEAIKVDVSDDVDKTSFANRNSAIQGSMRYFGLRLDTVPAWETLDWRRFQVETAFLDQFDKESQSLDSYINGGSTADTNSNDDGKKHRKRRRKKEDPPAASAPAATSTTALYLSDPQIMKANNDFLDQTRGVDTSQQMDALRQLVGELNDIASAQMVEIQNPANFYSFDRQRARDEITYRKALITDLVSVSNNVSRLAALPRTNQ